MARIKHFGRSKPLLEKTTFRSPKSCFFQFAIGRVSICNGALESWKSIWKAQCLLSKTVWKGKFVICSGALGSWKKHLRSSVRAPKSVRRENKKTTFHGLKSPFAVALWAAGKGTWKAQCLLPRVSGRKIKKQLFGAWKVVFLICNWKGLPLQWRSGQLEKAPEKLRGCSQECLEGK